MFRCVFGGLIVVALASVASAGHKPGHSPGGGGGTTTLGDSFVVVDSTGEIIPHTTLADDLKSAFIAVDVQFAQETVTITHKIDQNGITLGVFNTVRFGSFDCSTEPYVWPFPITPNIGTDGPIPSHLPTPRSSMLPNWKDATVIIDPITAGGPNTDARLIFIVDNSQIVSEVVINSYVDDAGDCITETGGYRLGIPVDELQFTNFRDDFHVLFPPPYRICKADDFGCIGP